MAPANDPKENAMNTPTEKQQIALEMARNGHKFIQIFSEAMRNAGAKTLTLDQMNGMSKALSEATGLDHVYIVQCVKLYREFVTINNLKPGTAL